MNNKWKNPVLAMTLVVGSALFSCNREAVETTGKPITIEAEIASSESSTRTVISGYERTEFISGDQIRITQKVVGSANKTVDYITGDGIAWGVLPGSTELTFTPGSTFSARYPANYTAITQDQTQAIAYLNSDLMETPAITSSDGRVAFVGDNKFVHKNVKISLEFITPDGGAVLDNTMTFRINAIGLRTGGGTADESLLLLRPDTDLYTWCGIAYPANTTKDIVIVLSSKGVDYTTTLSCGFIAGTHYEYTLTVNNNLLLPQGEKIADWVNRPIYTGDFKE